VSQREGFKCASSPPNSSFAIPIQLKFAIPKQFKFAILMHMTQQHLAQQLHSHSRLSQLLLVVEIHEPAEEQACGVGARTARMKRRGKKARENPQSARARNSNSNQRVAYHGATHASGSLRAPQAATAASPIAAN